MKKKQIVITVIFTIIILCFTLFVLNNIVNYLSKENFSTKKQKVAKKNVASSKKPTTPKKEPVKSANAKKAKK